MAIDRKLVENGKFLATLEPAVLEEFLAAGELKTFEDGDIVFAELEESDEIYLVVEGHLRHTFALAEAGSGLEDFVIGPGESSNLVRLFAHGPNHMTCVAEGGVQSVAWKADAVKAICERHPEVGYRLVSRAAGVFYERALRINRMLLDNMSWGLE